MRWSFIQRVRSTVSAPKYKTKDESCSSRSAPLVLGQLQRPVAERERVVGLQSHNVACGRGDGTAGPYISRIRTGVFHKQRRRTRMKGREAHSQLGKTGAYGETDLAVALLGFASSPGNQAALKTARVTPRSESTHERATLNQRCICCLCSSGWESIRKTSENYVSCSEAEKRHDTESTCDLNHFIAKVEPPSVSIAGPKGDSILR